MNSLYRQVTKRDSEAIIELFTRFDEKTPLTELEAAFERISEWGPSRPSFALAD